MFKNVYINSFFYIKYMCKITEMFASIWYCFRLFCSKQRKHLICDSTRSYQMPWTSQITEIDLYVRTYFWTSNISTMLLHLFLSLAQSVSLNKHPVGIPIYKQFFTSLSCSALPKKYIRVGGPGGGTRYENDRIDILGARPVAGYPVSRLSSQIWIWYPARSRLYCQVGYWVL